MEFPKGLALGAVLSRAVRTSSYEDAQKFFEDVFEMHMWREIGEKPTRKCWYKEGIQPPIGSAL